MSAARMSASRRDCSMTMTSDIHWDASISWLSRLCAVLIRASSISDFCSLCQEPAYQLIYMFRLVGGSCLAPHRQRGHLEVAPLGRRVVVHYTTAAPRQLRAPYHGYIMTYSYYMKSEQPRENLFFVHQIYHTLCIHIKCKITNSYTQFDRVFVMNNRTVNYIFCEKDGRNSKSSYISISLIL